MPIPTKPVKEEVEKRKVVGINKETVTDVSSTDFPGHYYGELAAWDVEEFRRGLKVQFRQNKPFDASFDLVGVDASIANAFRRILIAEIPTLAIDQVFMFNNTSVIQDEVLAQRLGLIPFKGGHEGLRKFMRWWKRPPAESDDPYSTTFDNNTVKLRLSIECTHKAAPPRRDETDPTKLYDHAHVYASDIVFEPQGRQAEYFVGDGREIAPVNPDILVAKLRPGQVIEADMHMHLGLGSDHAKWSPVATATYRIMPTITITEPVLGDDAARLQRCFAAGVIELEKVTKRDAAKAGSGYDGHEGELKAVVKDPVKDNITREVMRHPDLARRVKLGRKRDHFIFSIESTGQWYSDELFMEAVKTLRLKTKKIHTQVINMQGR